MMFRWTFMAAFTVYIFNMQAALGISAANAIEKSLFVVAALMCLLTRKIDFVVLLALASALALVLFQSLLVQYPGFSWTTVLGSINQFVIVYALLAMYPTVEDRRILLRFISFLAIGCSLLGLVYDAAGIFRASAVEFSTGMSRFRGSLTAAAFLSGIAMISVFAALQIVLKEGRRSYGLLVLVNFAILLLAGGRAAIVLTLILCAASVFMEKRIRFSSKIGMFAGGFTLFAAIFATEWERILNRFLNSGDNGRDVMWEYIGNLNRQYPTGIGFGHQFFSVPDSIKIVTGSYAAHNDFLRIALELSYPGMILFYGLFFLAVLRISTRRALNAGPLLLTAFLAFLVLSNSDNVIATPPYFPLLLVAYLASINFYRAPVAVLEGSTRDHPETARTASASTERTRPLLAPGTLRLE